MGNAGDRKAQRCKSGWDLHVREFTPDLGKDQKAAPALALEVPLT